MIDSIFISIPLYCMDATNCPACEAPMKDGGCAVCKAQTKVCTKCYKCNACASAGMPK